MEAGGQMAERIPKDEKSRSVGGPAEKYLTLYLILKFHPNL